MIPPVQHWLRFDRRLHRRAVLLSLCLVSCCDAPHTDRLIRFSGQARYRSVTSNS